MGCKYLVGSYNILKLVVATKAVASFGAIVVGWLYRRNGVNVDSLYAVKRVFFINVAVSV